MAKRETYAELISRIQPRVITEETEFKRLDKELGQLMAAQREHGRCEDRSTMIRLLTFLCEAWELAEVEREGELKALSPAERLANLLKAYNLSQAEFGRRANIARRDVSRVLSGERSFSKTIAAKTAAFFNLPISAFLEVSTDRAHQPGDCDGFPLARPSSCGDAARRAVEAREARLGEYKEDYNRELSELIRSGRILVAK